MSRSRWGRRERLSFDQGKKSGVNFDSGVVGAPVVAEATASIHAIFHMLGYIETIHHTLRRSFSRSPSARFGLTRRLARRLDVEVGATAEVD